MRSPASIAKLGAVILLTLTFGILERAYATSYYISANGSDSNNGTSETTPWLHAPGMANCSNTCASTTPQPGDQFIFRGGDVWHTNKTTATDGTRSVYMGGTTWNWTWSGSSSNCNYMGSSYGGNNGPTSSCIYLGVDQSWHNPADSSWSRPSLDMDNPLSGSLVSSCTYDQANQGPALFIGSSGARSYILLDNFNFYGHCVGSPVSAGEGWAYVEWNGIYNTIKNSYFHGWTMVHPDGTRHYDQQDIIGVPGSFSPATNPPHNVVDYVVFDGTDSYCTGEFACEGGGVAADVIEHSIFRALQCGACASNSQGYTYFSSIHDNLFELMHDSVDSVRHSDVIFNYGSSLPSGWPYMFYNNMVRNLESGQTIALGRAPGSPATLAVFNNILINIANPGNCFVYENSDSSTDGVFLHANNTTDGSCSMTLNHNNNLNYPMGTLTFNNNHFVAGTSSLPAFYGSGNPNLTTSNPNSSSEIFQTQSVANGQGYTSSNNYQPTSTSGATYHAGANLSSSCSSYSPDSALCYGSTGGVTNTAGSGDIPTLYIPNPAPRGTAWDAGADQFADGSSGVNPPTGLAAVVQ